MAGNSPGCTISAGELRAALDDAAETVVVDCRFSLLEPHAGFHAYLKGHIPGARYAHLDKDLAVRPRAGQGRHPLPEKDTFRRFLGACGIGERTPVVVYDDAGGAIAARMWWLLGHVGHERRAILDGGIQAWIRADLALTTTLPMIDGCDYPARDSLEPPPVTTAELLEIDLDETRLIDVRAADRYAGLEEPIDPVAGHIPGAANLPFSELLADDGRFRSPPALRESLRSLGADDTGDNVIAMCGSGVTACLLIAAAERAGAGHPRLYAGSWSEWIRDDSRPVEVSRPAQTGR